MQRIDQLRPNYVIAMTSYIYCNALKDDGLLWVLSYCCGFGVFWEQREQTAVLPQRPVAGTLWKRYEFAMKLKIAGLDAPVTVPESVCVMKPLL